MKKLFKPALIALSLAFTAPNIALAGGIPTVDPTAIETTISENLKTLEQLKEQLDAINQQIEQARQFANDTKNRLEGNWNLGDLISNDDFLRTLPKEAQDVLIGDSNSVNLDDLRNKYGLSSDNAQTQKSYDALMKYAERTKTVYDNTLKRIKNLDQIKKLADAADTPAKKADVANKLALEQLNFTQEQQALKQFEEAVNIQKKLEMDKVKIEAARSLKKARVDYKRRNAIQ